MNYGVGIKMKLALKAQYELTLLPQMRTENLD
jgi:hypothetical protein